MGFVKSSVGSFLGMQRSLALFSHENTSKWKSAERKVCRQEKGRLRPVWGAGSQAGSAPVAGPPTPGAAHDGAAGTCRCDSAELMSRACTRVEILSPRGWRWSPSC